MEAPCRPHGCPMRSHVGLMQALWMPHAGPVQAPGPTYPRTRLRKRPSEHSYQRLLSTIYILIMAKARRLHATTHKGSADKSKPPLPPPAIAARTLLIRSLHNMYRGGCQLANFINRPPKGISNPRLTKVLVVQHFKVLSKV